MNPTKGQFRILRRMAKGCRIWHRPGVRGGHALVEGDQGASRVAPATFRVLCDKGWISKHPAYGCYFITDVARLKVLEVNT